MKNITLTCLLILNFAAFGQSDFNIGFKEGFKNGYCYSNNQSGYYCNPPLPPLPPLPQISESSNSYQDGYNRGFLYGQSQRRNDDNNSSSNVSSNPPKFNDYINQLPINAMVSVGVYKQRIYDQRRDWIQQRIYNLNNLYSKTFNEDELPKNINLNNVSNTYYLPLKNYIKTIGNIDFSKDYEFNIIQDEFNKFENSFYNGRIELFKSTAKTDPTTNPTYSNNRSINIYVYRPWALEGFLLKIKVYIDNELIGKLKNDSGYVFNVPNTAYLKIKFQGFASTREGEIYIEPGKNNYYIRLDVDSNGFNWGLRPTSQGDIEYNQMKHKY